MRRPTILFFALIAMVGNLSAQRAVEPPLDPVCIPKPNTGTPPANDVCARAVTILPGQRIIGLQNINATKGLDFETPATVETTCIQSIENDLWFTFSTVEGQEWYEVVIAMDGCNTPAGLQALIIRSDDCTASKYSYRGCSNKINTDTIKLFLHEPQAGLRYLIWVDGYDGTFCDFELSLNARGRLNPDDYRFLRFDYALAEPADFAPGDLNLRFENNTAVIRWRADSHDPVAMYIIEQLPDLPDVPEQDRYARIVGFVDPKALVGVGDAWYSFTDQITNFQEGQRCTYRIVRVDEDGSRHASESFFVKPTLATSFYAADVKRGDLPDTYKVHYLNHKKGQDLRLQVLDAAGKVVKETVLPKEPVRDGDVTLQMAGFPAGEYTFIMSNGKESFRRVFYHEP